MGANFYPYNMDVNAFNAADLTDKSSLYTLVRKDKQGKLITIPYHVAYQQEVTKAANLLKEASNISENEELKDYLFLRSEALLTDRYEESDIAWLKMKSNVLDIIIGPIETYEDKLFGYKAANEAYVLIKDTEWSDRLEEITGFLPELQKALPVDDKFKQEQPGSNSQTCCL